MEVAKKSTVTPVVQRQAAAASSVATVSKTSRVSVQPSLKVSSPSDSSEVEAVNVAKKVMRMPVADNSIHYSNSGTGKVFRLQNNLQREKIQRQGSGVPTVSPALQSQIQGSSSEGATLPAGVKSFMEPRFKADFSNVKIHTSQKSAGMNAQLNAKAFTVGNHIFFGKNQFKPENDEGKELIAHELTHTIQQGAAIQRNEDSAITQSSGVQVQRFGLDTALNYIADKANYIPGFRMFTIILGMNPINQNKVDRSAANVLRAVIELLPGGALITQALDNHGIIDKVAGWIEQQINTLGMVGGAFKAALSKFLDSLSWTDIASPGDVWERAKRIFTEPINRIINFGKGLVTGVIKFIKEAILRPLAKLVDGTAGYDLLKAVLGEDPVTGDPVPRNAETLIGGFMKLIGQEEIWENIKKGNAIARAWAWFQKAMTELMGFVKQLPALFVKAFTSLEIIDIVLVPKAFGKIISVFGGFAGQFLTWAGGTVINLLQIIFEVVAPKAVPYLNKAVGAFKTIIKDPIKFVGNLVRAGKQGFQMFADNILEHLKTALIKWITGPLGEAGVYIPKAFSLMEIVKLVLSVLGLTWQNIRTKLVKIIPEPVLVVLEKTAGILVTLVKDGPAAAWEQIKTELSELKDQLIEQVTQMITVEVVKAAVMKLVSMLNPAGAVIQAIMAIYNTVTFFIEKINQIAAVVASFIDSVAEIASGAVTTAAKAVERTMANTLTIIIGFLAKFAGLGNIPNKLVGIIKKIRQPIDKGLDKIVGWLGGILKKLGGGADKRTMQEKERDVNLAKNEAQVILNNPDFDTAAVRSKLPSIKAKYKLTSIVLEDIGNNEFDILVEINPKVKTPPKKKSAKEDQKKIESYEKILGSLSIPVFKQITDPQKYREQMRKVIAQKFKNDLDGLNQKVLGSALISAAQNRIRGDIFEQWLEENGDIVRPGPKFQTGKAKFRMADGTRGNALIEAKVRKPDTRPSTTETEQMKAYKKILDDPKKFKIVNETIDNPKFEGPFVKVIYIFNLKTLIPLWESDLNKFLPGNQHATE